MLLVLLALPLVALPPLVLPETFALPDEADCEFDVVSVTSLWFETWTSVLSTLTTLLSEFGPVSETLPVLEPEPEPPPNTMSGDELLTLTEAPTELLFAAEPLPALPASVLPETFAEPEDAPWPLLFDTPRWLLFETLIWLDITDLTTFVEYGPVAVTVPSPVAAAAIPPKPAIRPRDVAATAVARIILLFTM